LCQGDRQRKQQSGWVDKKKIHVRKEPNKSMNPTNFLLSMINSSSLWHLMVNRDCSKRQQQLPKH